MKAGKTKSKYSLSIFFPAYNEEENIGELIKSALSIAPKITDDYEVIVVDDGSGDDTAKAVGKLVKKNKKIRLVRHARNRGYGEALKTGFRSAKKEVIFFTDGDAQFKLQELPEFLRGIEDFDAVVGYRSPRRDPKMRLLNALGWKWLMRIFFGLKVKDIDCAYKAIKKSVFSKIKVSSGGAMCSAELLIRMKDAGMKITEKPVGHYPRRAGRPTGAKLSVILRAFGEFWQIYKRDKTRTTFHGRILGALAVAALFASRIFLLSRSYDFFDSTQYGWRLKLPAYLEVISTGHPPFHPLYNFFNSVFYRLGFRDPTVAASLPSAVFGSLSIVLAYFLIKKLFNRRVACLASIVFAFLPFVWISQITVLVDPTEHFFYFLSLYLISFALDKNRWQEYSLSFAAGLSLALAAFAHTQVALWGLGAVAIVIIQNKDWSWANLKKIALKLILYGVGGSLAIVGYLPLMVYAANVRGDLDFYNFRAALKYLLLGNISDRANFSPIIYLRYIFTLGTTAVVLSAVAGGAKMLIKKPAVCLGLLIWLVPGSVIGSTYIYENLYGRALIIGLVPLIVFAAHFVDGLKAKYKILLTAVILAQALFLSLPAVWRYHKLPAANESLAEIERSSEQGGVFVASNVTRTWSDYQGEFVNFGDVGVGAAKVEEEIDKALFSGAPAYVSSDAIFLPYRRYDGEYFDIRSTGIGAPGRHPTLLNDIFNHKYLTLDRVSPVFKQFIYRIHGDLPEDPYRKISEALDNSDLVFGRILDSGAPVSSVGIDVFARQPCGAEKEDITRWDAGICLYRTFLGKTRSENWSFSDRGGMFALPAKNKPTKIVFTLSPANTKVENLGASFVERKTLEANGKYKQTANGIDELKKMLNSTEGSYYVYGRGAGSEESYEIYTFDFELPRTRKIEAENLGGEVGDAKKDALASGGMVRRSDGGAAGHLIGGPYIDLPRGRYKVKFVVSPEEPISENIVFDVVSDVGRAEHAKKELPARELAGEPSEVTLEFSLDQDVKNIEFRIKLPRGVGLGADYIELLVE